MGPVWKRLDFLGVAVHLYPQEKLSLLLGQSTVSTAVEAGVAVRLVRTWILEGRIARNQTQGLIPARQVFYY